MKDRSKTETLLAIGLSLWLGGSAESWLRMQADYDLWQSERRGRPAVKRLRRAA